MSQIDNHKPWAWWDKFLKVDQTIPQATTGTFNLDRVVWEMGKVQDTPPSSKIGDLWYDTWESNLWERKKTSPAMTSNILVVPDLDIAADSWIVWTASSPTNGFITVTVEDWVITFTSSASETCYFTYYILSIFALIKQKKSIAMSGTSLSISDWDIQSTTGIIWTASTEPNWFVQVIVSTWNITFTSTLSETCFFTYYIIN